MAQFVTDQADAAQMTSGSARKLRNGDVIHGRHTPLMRPDGIGRGPGRLVVTGIHHDGQIRRPVSVGVIGRGIQGKGL